MTATPLEQELADWLVASADQRTSERRRVDAIGPLRPSSGEVAKSNVSEPVGALRLWREELRRGYGGQVAWRFSTWRYDALWRAACCEANGLDALRDGLPHQAEYYFARAAAVITMAERAKRSAA